MKKTLALMAITACCAVPALAAPGSVAPESGTLYTSGTQTTTEGVALGKDMTFGSLSSSVIPGDSIPYGGNFYASSYTISLWLDSSSLSTGSQTALFGYFGSRPTDSYGANSLYLAADGKLGMGDGALTTSTGAFSQSRGDLSESAISLTGGLLNIALSVTGGNGNQAVDVYVNGDFFDSLSYNGNMNGNQSSVTSWINPNLTWGEIQWTNEALAEDRIAGFAGQTPVARKYNDRIITRHDITLRAFSATRRAYALNVETMKNHAARMEDLKHMICMTPTEKKIVLK